MKIRSVAVLGAGAVGAYILYGLSQTKDVDFCVVADGARKERLERDGSVLAVGKGNAEWNYSAPHGAGRIMSRKAAKDRLSLEEYRETMKGIYTTSVNEATLDEAPMAYKSLDDIIDVIRDSVDIIDVMKPVYNFKASE